MGLVLVNAIATLMLLLPAGGTMDSGNGSPASAETGSAQMGSSSSPGLTFTLDLATAYQFRGTNVFQSSRQQDFHGLLAPGVSWAVGDTGLWVGYWGAFQLNGPNRRDLVLEGVGHETDLSLGYDQELLEGDLVLGATLVAYLYVFADPEEAGTRMPLWIEPMASVTWDTAATLGLVLSYFTHVQEALVGYDYVYVNPSASRSIPLGDSLSLEPGCTAGIKLWTGGDRERDNTVDATADLTLAIDAGPLTLTPGVHLTWTNLEAVSLAGEAFVWGSVGASLEW